jgi:hypothetical protein
MTGQLALALADVDAQRERDRRGVDANGYAGNAGNTALRRVPSLALVQTRMAAVLDAAAQPGEPYAIRQALVDLSAVCVELAATMERPALVKAA